MPSYAALASGHSAFGMSDHGALGAGSASSRAPLPLRFAIATRMPSGGAPSIVSVPEPRSGGAQRRNYRAESRLTEILREHFGQAGIIFDQQDAFDHLADCRACGALSPGRVTNAALTSAPWNAFWPDDRPTSGVAPA